MKLISSPLIRPHLRASKSAKESARESAKQTDKPTDIQTYRGTDIHTRTQAHTHTHTHTHAHTHTRAHAHTHTGTQTCRENTSREGGSGSWEKGDSFTGHRQQWQPGSSGLQTHILTHRHTDKQAHRHTSTQTHRHTDTQTHRHTHTRTQAHRHAESEDTSREGGSGSWENEVIVSPVIGSSGNPAAAGRLGDPAALHRARRAERTCRWSFLATGCLSSSARCEPAGPARWREHARELGFLATVNGTLPPRAVA